MQNRKAAKVLGILSIAAMVACIATGCISINVQQPENSSSSNNSNNTTENVANTASNKSSDAKNASNQAGAANSSASNSASNASGGGRGNAEPLASQKVGSKPTGFITVPSDWKDRTQSDIKPGIIDSEEVTYVVDPTTEYTSPTFTAFAFSASIRMSSHPTDCTSYSDEKRYELKGLEGAQDITGENTEFLGHKASILRAYLAEDNIDVTYYIFDAHDDGHSCVCLECHSTPSTWPTVDEAVNSWTAS